MKHGKKKKNWMGLLKSFIQMATTSKIQKGMEKREKYKMEKNRERHAFTLHKERKFTHGTKRSI